MAGPKQSPSQASQADRRKQLGPSVKYQVFVEVLTGHATQGEAAERYGVNRMTGRGRVGMPGGPREMEPRLGARRGICRRLSCRASRPVRARSTFPPEAL